MNQELTKYVVDQRAAGFSDEQIQTALKASGWDAKTIGDLFKPAMETPVTMSQVVANPKRKAGWVLPTSLFVIGAIIGGGGVYGYDAMKTKAPAATPTPSASASAVASPSTSPVASPTLKAGQSAFTLENTDFTFNYPSTWHLTTAAELISGTKSSDKTTDPTVFLSSSDWNMVKAKVAAGGLGFDEAVTTMFKALAVVSFSAETSEDAALNATKSVCTGTEISADTSNPARPKMVVPTAINSIMTGYGVLQKYTPKVVSEAGCDIPSVTYFVPAYIRESNDIQSASIGFTGTTLTTEQKIVLNSIDSPTFGF